MELAFNLLGERIEATPNQTAYCSICKFEVISKCGNTNIWHWAHKNLKDCDTWSEGETLWHKEWKERYPVECREVVMENHRADIKIKDLIIELQNSSISSDEIIERENFYNKMIWILNLTEKNINQLEGGDFIIKEKQNKNGNKYLTFKWKHMKRSFLSATKPIYLDFGEGYLLLIKKLYPEGTGWGIFVIAEDLQ